MGQAWGLSLARAHSVLDFFELSGLYFLKADFRLAEKISLLVLFEAVECSLDIEKPKAPQTWRLSLT